MEGLIKNDLGEKHASRHGQFSVSLPNRYVKRTFAIRFRYLLMNAVALRPVSGSF